ncbi:hypothetical protein NEAUS03_0822 [Nematocida ausubeli]|nr:hypothetical protein NEAUS03_0822 [Nematocida ausubeli]
MGNARKHRAKRLFVILVGVGGAVEIRLFAMPVNLPVPKTLQQDASEIAEEGSRPVGALNIRGKDRCATGSSEAQQADNAHVCTSPLFAEAEKSADAVNSTENAMQTAKKAFESEIKKLAETKRVEETASASYKKVNESAIGICAKMNNAVKLCLEKWNKIETLKSAIRTFDSQSLIEIPKGVHPEYDIYIKEAAFLFLALRLLEKVSICASDQYKEQNCKLNEAREKKNCSDECYAAYLAQCIETQKKYRIVIEQKLVMLKCMACHEGFLCAAQAKKVEYVQSTGADVKLLKVVLCAHLQSIECICAVFNAESTMHTLQKDCILKLAQTLQEHLEYHAAAGAHIEQQKNVIKANNALFEATRRVEGV